MRGRRPIAVTTPRQSPARIPEIELLRTAPRRRTGPAQCVPGGSSLRSYRVSAGSFFQTNRYLTDELVKIVTINRRGRTPLALYAGVGSFSAVLSLEFERVIAVESSQQSVADLAYNSPASVKALRVTVEQYLTNVAGKVRPDLVVVDPPRGGLGERVARGVAQLAAPVLTYVSCDPAT